MLRRCVIPIAICLIARFNASYDFENHLTGFSLSPRTCTLPVWYKMIVSSLDVDAVCDFLLTSIVVAVAVSVFDTTLLAAFGHPPP